MGCLPKVFMPKLRDSEKKLYDEEKHNPPSSGDCGKADSGTGTTNIGTNSGANSGTHVESAPRDVGSRVEAVVHPVVVTSDGGGDGVESPGTILTQSGSLRKPNDLRDFSYQELRNATKSFDRKNLLGEGGFGQVFRGTIKQKQKFGGGEEKIDVAVKQLNSRSQQGHKEWLAEVHFLGLVDCPHLVKLIGYCATDDDERGIQRLLVYEFMQNKGLDDHLFNRGPNCLSWASRVKIALGAARGLAYLHEELEIQIIFRDFKTSNVLLDEDFEPKLSDFGLARQGPQDGDSHVSTAVVGTAGYAAPEYIQTGHLTVKSDVWSFGIVMLEVLTGRRVMDRNRPKNEQRLVEWAKPFISDHHKLFQVVDPSLNGRYPVRPAHRFAQLAYQCLHKFPKHRPKMSEVVEKLKAVQERTVQWESPSAQSPSSLGHSQEFSRSSRDRGLTLGSLPSVRSGKVSKFSPRIRDSASSQDVSKLISTLSLECHSANSGVDSTDPKPKLVAEPSVEEPKPVDATDPKPKLLDATEEEPKQLSVASNQEPKLVVIEEPNRVHIPVDTPAAEEPTHVDDTETEEPKLPVDMAKLVEEPKAVGTAAETPMPVEDPDRVAEASAIEKPKLVDVSGQNNAPCESVKRRSWGSDRLARMSRESGRFTWIPKLYGSMSSSS